MPKKKKKGILISHGCDSWQDPSWNWLISNNPGSSDVKTNSYWCERASEFTVSDSLSLLCLWAGSLERTLVFSEVSGPSWTFSQLNAKTQQKPGLQARLTPSAGQSQPSAPFSFPIRAASDTETSASLHLYVLWATDLSFDKPAKSLPKKSCKSLRKAPQDIPQMEKHTSLCRFELLRAHRRHFLKH